jgi:hypothetical protein
LYRNRNGLACHDAHDRSNAPRRSPPNENERADEQRNRTPIGSERRKVGKERVTGCGKRHTNE